MNNEMMVIFDIEATGLDSSRDQITEIGAILIQGDQIVDRFNTLVSIKGKVPENIVELTGITDSMLKGQPKIEEALMEFLKFIGDYPLVAHNASFDIGFIQTKLKQQGFEQLENEVYDTLKLARTLLTTIKKHNLGVLSQYLGVENPEHHRAVNDCEVLLKIFNIFRESLRRQGKDLELCKIS